MSTFYGGEEIINVVAAGASRTGTTGTTAGYIVPVGRYALVQFVSASTANINHVSASASANIGPHNVLSASGQNESSSFISLGLSGFFLLTAGEAISVTLTVFQANESVSISARVKEFVSPN